MQSYKTAQILEYILKNKCNLDKEDFIIDNTISSIIKYINDDEKIIYKHHLGDIVDFIFEDENDAKENAAKNLLGKGE